MLLDDILAATKPQPTEPCLCLSGIPFEACCGNPDSKTPPKEIIIKHNAIADKRCEEFIRYFKNQPKQWLQTGSQKSLASGKKSEFSSGRVTQSIKKGKYSKKIAVLVERALKEIIQQEFNHTLQWFEDPDVLYYTTGGVYKAHADSEYFKPETKSWHKVLDRDYSVLMYLTDDFEGGNITFNAFDFSYRPKKGDMIFFPSDRRYLHTAEPVTSGERYAIVSWCAVTESQKLNIEPPRGAIMVDS